MKPFLAFFLLIVCQAAPGAPAQAPDRSVPPLVGPPPSLQLPPLQRFSLACGLAVVLMEKHQVPLVQMNLLVRTGSAMDPLGKSGLASITADLMTEGAGSRSALELADAIDFLGAHLSVSSDQHASVVRLFTPLSQLDPALDLFADVTLRPAFPKDELERKRKELLTTLLQWRDEPRALAAVTFQRTLYGDQHPYGRPTLGDEQTIRSFQPDDLRQFHQTWFRPNHATLIIVGDVTVASLRDKLETLFAAWQPAPPPPNSLPPIKQIEQRPILLVDKPDAAQTEIRLGRVGAPRLTPDYYAIVVLNTILGGSFTSRLNQNLREQHGYTYGARSLFDFRPLPGPFLAAAAVQTAVTDKAITEFLRELEAIRAPAPPAELERAKNYVAFSYPAGFQSIGDIASALEEWVQFSLPEDHFNRYIPRILAVSQEEVSRAAQKYIDPANLAFILVGDRKAIESPLAELKLGPTQFLTVEDVLGKAPVTNP